MSWEEFLKQTLNWKDYENLQEILKETPHMTTKIKKSPHVVKWEHAQVISELLRKRNPQCTIEWLMENYLTTQTSQA